MNDVNIPYSSDIEKVQWPVRPTKDRLTMPDLFRNRKTVLFAIVAGGAALVVVGLISSAARAQLGSHDQAGRTVTPTPSNRPLPPDKQAIADREEQAHQRGLGATPPPNALVVPTNPRGTPTPFPDQIVTYKQPPMPSSVYRLTDKEWMGSRGGSNIAVYAGAEAADLTQCIVAVIGSSGKTDVYRTPTKSGALTITAQNGDVLTLTSTSGTVFRFNLIQRAFV